MTSIPKDQRDLVVASLLAKGGRGTGGKKHGQGLGAPKGSAKGAG